MAEKVWYNINEAVASPKGDSLYKRHFSLVAVPHLHLHHGSPGNRYQPPVSDGALRFKEGERHG